MKGIAKKVFFIICLFSMGNPSFAKNYRFDINRSYELFQVRVSRQGTKLLKVTAIAGTPDKAILLAKSDAVAAAIFEGYPANFSAGVSVETPPLITIGKEAYKNNKKFFDVFFKKGEFLNYVRTVNSRYPSGEDNVSTPKGRKVGVYLVVEWDSLRKYLEEKQIIRSFDNIFELR